MEHTISVSASVHVAVPRPALFDWFIPIELPRILLGYGPVPAITATSGQTGAWDQPGSSRTVHLADGSTAREQVTVCVRPSHFGYRVGEFTGNVRHLATGARGAWTFDESGAGGGTDVRWTYTFVARSAVARVVLAPVVRVLWRGFMRAALQRMVELSEAETRDAAGRA
jgi:hypothetical protein